MSDLEQKRPIKKVQLCHRKRNYRKEWEQDVRFKGWITSSNKGKNITADNSKAKCLACNIEMTAEVTVLKNHSNSAKHMSKTKSLPTQCSITDMFKKTDTTLEHQITIAEMKLTGCLA
ncbi:hypothetical protein ABEB36_005366 [Hypothenemus hampei]|uniref:Uncharacterized protein n=1 Tax=Hypothenemus hampei TaxID=57062 RepID=A0ABD1EY03_HYPHA